MKFVLTVSIAEVATLPKEAAKPGTAVAAAIGTEHSDEEIKFEDTDIAPDEEKDSNNW